MNEIELRQLRCLVTLADERNFGRAAARLHMSQPPLTRLLSDVERAVGAKLFERTTRRVGLTPIGEVFISEAREVLARAETAMESVRAAVRREAGQVRLAYTPLALQTVLPQLLAAFREREHDVSVDLAELPGRAQRAALAAGRIDLAFSDEPVPEAEYGSALLHREPLSLLVPEGHPFAARAAISFEEIERGPLILHPRQEYPGYYDRVMAAVREAGIAPEIVHREPGQNCAALVVAGRGLLLTSSPHTRLPIPGLHLVAIETEHPIHEEIWGVWSDPRLSRQARILADILQAHSLSGAKGNGGGHSL